MFNFRKSKERINIIFKDHVLRYIECDTPELTDVVDYGERYLESGIIEEGKVVDARKLSSIIEELVEEKEWRKKKVYFSVPDASVIIKPFHIPNDLKTADEVKGYLYMQIGEGLHLPFEEPVFDYVVLEEKTNMNEVLLFAYPESRVRAFESALLDANTKPAVADLTFLSLYRLYYDLDHARSDDHLLSLQWNLDGIVLTVFHNCHPQFTRYMKSGLDLALWEVPVKGDAAVRFTGDEQEIEAYIEEQMREVERIMNFYRYSVTNGESAVTNLLISGDFPLLHKVYEKCQNTFQLNVKMIDSHEFSEAVDETIPFRFAESVGLALKP